MDRFLGETRRGTSGALVLRGEPGVGKSALLGYAVASATDMNVLATRGMESEAELAFASLADVARPLREYLGDLPPPQASALAGALALGPVAPGDRFSVCAATLSLLAEAAEKTPVLVCADDTHWLDTASAEALVFTARRLGVEGIAMLFAVRAGEPSQLDGAQLPELHLSGLDDAAAAQLLAYHSHRTVAASVAAKLAALTAGNPLALTELADRLDEDQLAGATPLEEPLPVTVSGEHLFQRRLERLPGESRRLLVIVAVAGSPETAVLAGAAEAAGIDMAVLGPAEAAGLVQVADGRVEFCHPLLRSAVYRQAEPNLRRAAHGWLATALEGHGSDQARDSRIWHLAAAAIAPDDDLAQSLEATAERGIHRRGYAAGARAYARAAELTADDHRRAQRLLAGARAAHLAGQPFQAIRLLEDATARAAEPLLRADIGHLRAVIEAWHGRPSYARALLTEEAQRVEREDPTRAAWMLTSAANVCNMNGDLETAQRLNEMACALADGSDPATRAMAYSLLGGTMIARGETREGRRLLQDHAAGPAAGDFNVLARIVFNVAMPLIWAEEYDRAREVIERGIVGARASAALGTLPYSLLCLAELELRTGAWYSAYASASESVRLATETGLEGVLGPSLTRLALVEAHRGQRDECMDHLEHADALVARLGVGSGVLYVMAARGLLELGSGRMEATIRHLEPLTAATEQIGAENPTILQDEPNLIEAYVRVGRRGDARRLLARLQEQAQRTGNTWALAVAARCRGLLAESPQEADGAFVQSLSWHERTPTPFERARTQLCWGERLRRERRRAEARERLRPALKVFERLAAAPWAERARGELKAAGTRPRRRGEWSRGQELTAQELQVALAVAAGRSNPQVAAELFLSRKTVEYHLSNVYRKLQVASRTQLTRLLATEGMSGGRRGARPGADGSVWHPAGQ